MTAIMKSENEIIIICAENKHDDIDDFADNLAKAIKDMGGASAPIYISRCNWQVVNEDNILISAELRPP